MIDKVKADETRARLEAMLRDDPNNSTAQSMLGVLNHLEKNEAEATGQSEFNSLTGV